MEKKEIQCALCTSKKNRALWCRLVKVTKRWTYLTFTKSLLNLLLTTFTDEVWRTKVSMKAGVKNLSAGVVCDRKELVLRPSIRADWLVFRQTCFCQRFFILMNSSRPNGLSCTMRGSCTFFKIKIQPILFSMSYFSFFNRIWQVWLVNRINSRQSDSQLGHITLKLIINLPKTNITINEGQLVDKNTKCAAVSSSGLNSNVSHTIHV